MPDEQLPPEQEDLAAELAAQLGRAQGADLLKLARAAAVFNGTRPGTSTSEFRMSAIAVVVGGGLVALGSYFTDPALRAQGLELIQWAVAAYAVSRGISKIGPKS